MRSAPSRSRASLGSASNLQPQYAPFLAALEEGAARFARPVLAVHGDEHDYIVDQPLRAAPNLTHMQVPGSPEVGWVKVTVRPGTGADAKPKWGFEGRVVEGWKFW